MQDFIGLDIGRYHIVGRLGQGGMATVYKAYDTNLDREVALKFIRRDAFPEEIAQHVLKRFEREAKTLARLSHPNIVRIYDYGEYAGSPYLVMEYINGGTLKTYTGQPLGLAQAVNLLAPVARGLDYAHQHGVVHRDVKPANILITAEGIPMLSDFGVAKILEGEGGNTLTGTGVGVGTPEYMAPEQWVNQVVPQTDIYALAVVFYELITAHRPFTADTPAAVLLKQMNDPLPRPKSFVPNLPDAVEGVLYKALAKAPEARYRSMGEFAAALENLAAGMRTQAPPPQAAAAPLRGAETIAPTRDAQTSGFAPQRPGGRRPWNWLLAALGLALVLGLCLAAGLAALALRGYLLKPAETVPGPTPTLAAPAAAAPPALTAGPALALPPVATLLPPAATLLQTDTLPVATLPPNPTLTLSPYPTPPLNQWITANVSQGLRTGPEQKGVWFGPVKYLYLAESERGKTLVVTVVSGTNELRVELWDGLIDLNDHSWWSSHTQVALSGGSGSQPKLQTSPRLSWTIEPGPYTVFLAGFNAAQSVPNYAIKYKIEINP